VLTSLQANTTAARTFPSLTSLTKSAGDLLIAIVVAYQSTATANAVWGTWGASFTEFLDASTTSTMAIGAAYKFSTGSETGTFTVTQGATVTGHAGMILMSIAGAHVSAPPEGGSYATGTASAADPASFGPSWGADDTLWISVGASGETGTGGTYSGLTSSPTNFSGDVLTGISADAVGGVEGGVGFRQLNAATQDVGTWSLDTSNARNAAVVIAVRPVFVPPPPRHGFVNYQDPGIL
jgi:hypothetical protein